MDRLQVAGRLILDALSKARELSKINKQGHPELQSGVLRLMKIVRESRQTLDALVAEVSEQNGKLDKETLNRELESVIEDMERVNRKLDDLLAKARA